MGVPYAVIGRIQAPATVTREDDWRDSAACLDTSPEMYFPEPDWKPTIMARQVCAGCPVAAQCLEFALVNEIKSGIFGGTTPYERSKMKAAR